MKKKVPVKNQNKDLELFFKGLHGLSEEKDQYRHKLLEKALGNLFLNIKDEK